MASLKQFVRPVGDRVAGKVIDGEAILIDMSTGNYFSLAGSAGFIWSLIEQGPSLARLADTLAAVYGISPESAEADALAFAQSLVDEGLVEFGDKALNAELEAPSAPADREYTAPSFEKFSDMAEMFALDPPLPGIAGKD